jgi:uncharacterized membrane protein (UPF0182 family)
LFTLLNSSGSGSKVIQGNLLVVPIEQSLLYVRPIYVQSENQPLPEFRKVLVVFGDRAVAADTLHDALVSLFGDAPATLEQGTGGTSTAPTTPGGTTPGTTPPGGNVSPDVRSLLDQANAAFDAADAALRTGDLAEFQKQVKIAQQLTKQARDQSAAAAAAPPTSTTTTTAPPASA